MTTRASMLKLLDACAETMGPGAGRQPRKQEKYAAGAKLFFGYCAQQGDIGHFRKEFER